MSRSYHNDAAKSDVSRSRLCSTPLHSVLYHGVLDEYGDLLGADGILLYLTCIVLADKPTPCDNLFEAAAFLSRLPMERVKIAMQTLQTLRLLTHSKEGWIISKQPPRPSLKDRAGVVYLIEGNGHYKIGSSANLTGRLRCLKTAMPFVLQVIHTITTQNPQALEKYWHERFKERRTRREWFTLTQDDIKEFVSYVDVQ